MPFDQVSVLQGTKVGTVVVMVSVIVLVITSVPVTVRVVVVIGGETPVPVGPCGW